VPFSSRVRHKLADGLTARSEIAPSQHGKREWARD
jgi:hypothetical protein